MSSNRDLRSYQTLTDEQTPLERLPTDPTARISSSFPPNWQVMKSGTTEYANTYYLVAGQYRKEMCGTESEITEQVVLFREQGQTGWDVRLPNPAPADEQSPLATDVSLAEAARVAVQYAADKNRDLTAVEGITTSPAE